MNIGQTGIVFFWDPRLVNSHFLVSGLQFTGTHKTRATTDSKGGRAPANVETLSNFIPEAHTTYTQGYEDSIL